MFEALIALLVALMVGSALYHTYRALRARRRAEILSMVDEGFASEVPPWDEGSEQIEPGTLEAQMLEWSDYWFQGEEPL